VLKEAIFVMQNAEHIGVEFDDAIQLITDNKAAHDIVKHPGATKHTTHFERRLHFARDHAMRGAANVHLTVTANMMADIFTKATDKTTFLRCRDYLVKVYG